MSRTYKVEGVVLKRRNLGEADRLVTIFSRERGKLAVLAKGVRKLTSRRAASLEPATQARFLLYKGKGIDTVSQTELLTSFQFARKNLSRLTQVHQLLEVVDLLTRENQDHPDVYSVLLDTLSALNTRGKKRVVLVDNIRLIVKLLGFGEPNDHTEGALKAHLEEISEKELRSKMMLEPSRSDA